MSMKHISLPDAVNASVDKQDECSRNASDDDEYVRELARRERDRQNLRGLLLTEARSAPSQPVDDGFFEGLRVRVRSP